MLFSRFRADILSSYILNTKRQEASVIAPLLDITGLIKSNPIVPHGFLFDLDDTLIDRTGAFDRYACWVGRCHGRSIERNLREADESLGLSYGDRVAATAPCIGTTPQECWQHLWRHLPLFIEPNPAVNEILVRLRRNVPVGLVTNGGTSVQRAKMKSAQLDGLFDAVVISEEVGFEKPSPEIFSAACATLGVGQIGTWMIGDDPQADVKGAQSCGLVSCWVSRGRSWPGGPPPDQVVEDVIEIWKLVG